MFEVLYNIFIMPVETLVEIVFYTMNKFFSSEPAISIIFLSLVVNLLILPLYKRADDMQEAERDKQSKMERWNKHIRATFKGDERYMMQNAYYRIENYKPLQAIMGSLSLLFQIPFFMAAYHFLSHLYVLRGASFLIISDLSKPDALFHIGNFGINVLPILMTVINIVSGILYTKGFKLKDKLQLYGMALLFLVILYNSPSGLVLYWTCNNLFSLGKNIFFKYVKKPRAVVNVVSALVGTGLFGFLLITHRLVVRRQIIMFGCLMVVSYIPLLLSLLQKVSFAKLITDKINSMLSIKPDEKKSINSLFWAGVLLLTVIMGIMIPAVLIQTSPLDFADNCKDGPMFLILKYTIPVYFGLFFVWVGIFYQISGDKLKKVFAYGLCICAVVGLVDYYFFFAKLGVMNSILKFDDLPVYNDMGKLINLVVIIPVVALVIFLVKKWPKVVSIIMLVASVAFLVQGAVSMSASNKVLLDANYYAFRENMKVEPTVPLSRNGKNVVVIMLDRAIGAYVPYIFAEKPELAKEYEDFTFYPNTVSFGGYTNYGAPALFGGYEYTPTAINERDDEPMWDKHDEAMLLMPVIFANEGYEVFVADQPYAGFSTTTDLSIYEPYENVTGLITRDKYVGNLYETFDSTPQKKHLFMYSLFRTVPVLLQNSVYDAGDYLGRPGDSGVLPDCAEGYAFLDNMSTYTYIEDDDVDRAFFVCNLTTHSPSILSTPEYEISDNPAVFPYNDALRDSYILDGERLKMDSWEQVGTYHVNMASYILLSHWFDYLKEEGVYDNTRIIIVADHGRDLGQLESLITEDGVDVEHYNPVLMVKDFADSTELMPDEYGWLGKTNIRQSNEFMTNADVPTLAMKGIVDNPVNPFTGNAVNMDEKYAHPQRITTSENYDVHKIDGNKFDTEGAPWYDVWDNIFESSNWVRVQ